MKTLARTLGIWIVACAVLVAADFWEEKDFTAWSDKDVEKMLTDSQWSQKVTIPLGGPGGGGFGGGRGRGGGDGFGAPPRRMTLTVSWRSALPVKQALVRSQIGVDAPISLEQQQFLAQLEPLYVVSVAGFPLQFARMAQDRDALLAETLLEREDKEPISPGGVEIFIENGETVTLQYVFPRDDEITLEDQDVELVTKLGQMEVKRKFKLEDMVFEEQLAL